MFDDITVKGRWLKHWNGTDRDTVPISEVNAIYINEDTQGATFHRMTLYSNLSLLDEELIIVSDFPGGPEHIETDYAVLCAPGMKNDVFSPLWWAGYRIMCAVEKVAPHTLAVETEKRSIYRR